MCASSPPASVNFSEVSKIGRYLDRTPPSPHFFTASLFPPAPSLHLPQVWTQILPQSLFSSSEQELWNWSAPTTEAGLDAKSYSHTALTFCNDSSQFDLSFGKEQLCLSSHFWLNALEDHPSHLIWSHLRVWQEQKGRKTKLKGRDTEIPLFLDLRQRRSKKERKNDWEKTGGPASKVASKFRGHCSCDTLGGADCCETLVLSSFLNIFCETLVLPIFLNIFVGLFRAMH